MELNISSLTRIYGDPQNGSYFSLQLPDLSLGIPGMVFVMGHNGAGKSLFLRLLAGEEHPSNDLVKLTLGGREWNPQHTPWPIVRQNVDLNLALDLTVRENLTLHLSYTTFAGLYRPLTKSRAIIEKLVENHPEIRRKLDQPCRYLSGGQKQALGVIAISAHRLPLLLLDEFLGAADQSTTTLLLRLVSDYTQNTPACALIVSHDVRLALAHASRILVLRAGRLTKDISSSSTEWTESDLRNAIQG